jgi:hypothetical protein
MAHEKVEDIGELRHKYARTATRGRGAAAPLSLPIPFLPMVPLFFFPGSRRRWPRWSTRIHRSPDAAQAGLAGGLAARVCPTGLR